MSGYPIYFLWATPRSTSTAFEWMMRQRGDLTCFHEPFGIAWYKGPEARAPRPPTPATRQPNATFERIWDDILEAAEKQPVFVKDMPHHTTHLWTKAFLDRISHSFLIRDPAKVLSSLHNSYQKAGLKSGFEPEEISFGPQNELFDQLVGRSGVYPTVIDSDDLLEDPDTMVRMYCEAIGIPFIAEALHWEKGSRTEVLWYDNNEEIWHASLRESDGLRPMPRKFVEPGNLPDNLSKYHGMFFANYSALYPYRLRNPNKVLA